MAMVGDIKIKDNENSYLFSGFWNIYSLPLNKICVYMSKQKMFTHFLQEFCV